ncbi:hypothetical protein PPERSA_01516 [Pseudocohnilembus persalinus]|uniref:Uncharacterized protein n=1 Tax=Pseudocohnilembus persalinus TaxID=266149 RepID=A0A0V0R8G6_PSEPJ|nr:hypothetical protein PPERSA_01516 [Pseudocohnilembus persalinus]|eukprot:KRX10504.1 hypothetical protein PPERSA_01516 [Pseudocohnilembus persalinus]
MPPKKISADPEEIKKLYDPNTFYEHGSNPVLKRFMELMVENNNEGRMIDYRTYVTDKYTKMFYARNFEDFLQRDCKAFTFTRAFALWIGATWAFGVAGCYSRALIPVGNHGITRVAQTQFYHLYGPIGVSGVVGFWGTAAYLWYKTTVFTAKKFYHHVLLGERQWIYEMERQNPGYGEYFFNDTPWSQEESFSDLARGEMAKKPMEKGLWQQ